MLETHSKNKICSSCKVVKTQSEYHKNPDKNDGLSYSCKSCVSNKKKTSYKKKLARKNHLKAVRTNSNVLDVSKMDIEIWATGEHGDEELLLSLLRNYFIGPNSKVDWSDGVL